MTVSNDGFGDVAHNSTASNRPTLPTVGGIRRASPTEVLGGLGAMRQPPDVDERRSAGLDRLLSERRPRNVKLSGQAVAAAGKTTIIDLGGPTSGFSWDLRRVNAGPIDYAAAAAAGSFPAAVTTIAVVTQRAAGNVPAAGQQVISTTAAFPVEGTWGRGEVSLAEGERLYLLIVGLADGYQLTAGGQAEETATTVGEIYSLG